MPSDDSVGDAAWLDDLDELDKDELIEQMTVDAYGDEGYRSFRQAFEDHVEFPVTASVVGAEVTVSGIHFDGDERRGVTATVGASRPTIAMGKNHDHRLPSRAHPDGSAVRRPPGGLLASMDPRGLRWT